MTIDSKIDALVEFQRNIPKLVRETIEANEGVILELNWESQLYNLGIDRLGNSLTPGYARKTIANKIAKGDPYDRVTLFDTGAFYDSMYIIADEEEFIVTSDDMKTSDLTMKYGDDIFGLTEENMDILTDRYIMPSLLKALKEV